MLPSAIFFGYLNFQRYLCCGNLTLCPVRSGLSARVGMQSGQPSQGFRRLDEGWLGVEGRFKAAYMLLSADPWAA